MLRVRGLQAGYGKITALWGVDFDVGQGEIVALVGANGAGKTTTLKAISGLVRPQAGAVLLDGEPLTTRTTMEIVARGVVHVPEGRKLFPEMTVRDNLLMGGFTPAARPHQPERLERVYSVFPRLRERAAQVLMLDEPSLGLAPIMVDEMFRVIGEINRQGVTVLLVEQNTEHALAIAHRGFVLESGRVVLTGTGAELLADPKVREAYLGL
jgi:branched-chain amino acid transport system ATP-binding protein